MPPKRSGLGDGETGKHSHEMNGSPPRSAGLLASESIDVAAAEQELGALRAAAREFVEEVLQRDVPLPLAESGDDIAALVEDLQLIVSELATNVIRHTPLAAMNVMLSARRDDDVIRWTIDVAGADSLPRGPVIASAPEPTATSGRGLFIVSTVAPGAEVIDLDDRCVVRCTLATSAT